MVNNGENKGNGSPNGDHLVTFYKGKPNEEIEQWAWEDMQNEAEAMPQPKTSFCLPRHFSGLVEQADIQQYTKDGYRMGSFMLSGLNNIMYSLLVFNPTKFLECLELYRSEIEQKLSFLEKEYYSIIDRASLLDPIFVGTLADVHGALVSLLNMKDNEWKTNNFRFAPIDKNPTSILENIKSTAREIVLQGHTYVTIAQKSTDMDQYRDLSQLYHYDRKKFIILISKLNTLTESHLREDIPEHQLIEEADKAIKESNIQSATTFSKYISEFMQPTFLGYLRENTNSGYAPLLNKFISTLSDIGSFDSSIFVPEENVTPQRGVIKIDTRTKLVSFDGLEGLVQHTRGWDKGDPHNVEFSNAQAPSSLRQFVNQYTMVVNLILKYTPDPNSLTKNINYLEIAVTEALQHIEDFFKTPETWKPDFDAPILENMGERKLLSDFLRNTKIKVTKKVKGELRKTVCPISEYLEKYVGGVVLRDKINNLINIELQFAKDTDPNQIEEIRKRIFTKKKEDHSVTSKVIAS